VEIKLLRLHRVVLTPLLNLSAPTFADQEKLPQTMAFVLETYRWRPVSAGGAISCIFHFRFLFIPRYEIGFAHKATKDIIWVRPIDA
jgi:hypothetical protein